MEEVLTRRQFGVGSNTRSNMNMLNTLKIGLLTIVFGLNITVRCGAQSADSITDSATFSGSGIDARNSTQRGANLRRPSGNGGDRMPASDASAEKRKRDEALAKLADERKQKQKRYVMGQPKVKKAAKKADEATPKTPEKKKADAELQEETQRSAKAWAETTEAKSLDLQMKKLRAQ